MGRSPEGVFQGEGIINAKVLRQMNLVHVIRI